ncbi:MAG: hypothetical protein UY34_C0033G0012 [Parcubacteria group bacterium GW2011_GWA2_48_9]|nr:MAG: hypothetical protein UY34_C0033G0012 [Parcubacteria group bacterium GW2011_GWA2_48_9]
MANQWFKLYGSEYLSDPKMKSLTACERSCWLSLLCYASVSSVEGEVMYLTEKQLMLDAGVDALKPEWNETVGLLKKFEQFGMTKSGNASQIIIAHWSQRQVKNAFTGYERTKRHREREKSKGQIENMQTDSFTEFWTAYPRKTQKQIAFKSWCKVNPDPELRMKILTAIAQQSKSPQWTKDEGQFIPHPATWLNQQRWDDQMTITRPKVGGGKFDNLPTKKA